MKDTKDMLARQVTTMRTGLERSRERIKFLEGALERTSILADVEARRRGEIEEQRNKAQQDLNEARRLPPLYERMQFETLTRAQLISLIEGAINEARRKGMTEAEGLVSRHSELTRETDLEMMRGIVKRYQERITELENDKVRQERAKADKVELDRRPLSEKLATPFTPVSAFTPRPWWRVDVPQPPVTSHAPPSYVDFDKRAAAIAAEAKAREPKTLYNGEVVRVVGDSGKPYILERRDNTYSCTCLSWTFSKEPATRRTCKHLTRYLGEKAETERTTRPAKVCHCGVPLVNGQCQIHTRDWKGSELCECGRKFASCKAAYDTISVAQRKFGHQPRLR